MPACSSRSTDQNVSALAEAGLLVTRSPYETAVGFDVDHDAGAVAAARSCSSVGVARWSVDVDS